MSTELEKESNKSSWDQILSDVVKAEIMLLQKTISDRGNWMPATPERIIREARIELDILWRENKQSRENMQKIKDLAR